MSQGKLARRRGVLLSDRGLRRLHESQRDLAADNGGGRISLEALSAGASLSTRTLSRVMNRESRVDIRTLETLFFALNLVLDETDYEYSEFRVRESWRMQELPRRLTTLLGRDGLLERLDVLIDNSPLLTLTGAGGIGKTRLAIELAVRRQAKSDVRIWFVDLTIVKDPRESISSLTAAFGIPPHAPGTLAGIAEQLAGRSGLLVLDSCEHVTQSLGPFLVELLNACSALRVIATSRESFSVEGERVFRVPPLAVPKNVEAVTAQGLMQYPAVALFVERAAAHNESFALHDAIAATICEIVQRLDGLPLAIELAAARADVMSPADLLEYLRARFIGLASEGTEHDPRHRSIRTLMDWSFEHLTSEERLVCRRASVFAGSFDAAALSAVCADAMSSAAATDAAFKCVRKSLFEMDAQVNRTRYFYLGSVREYAWSQLNEAGESIVCCWLHALYYLDLTRNVMKSFCADDQAEALRLLEREFGNVRAALQWAFTVQNEHIGAVLVSDLPEYWDARGQYREGEGWIWRALAINDDLLAQATRAKLFEGLSLMLFRQMRLEEALDAAALSLAAFEAVCDDVGVCRARNLIGIIALDAGNGESARELFATNLERGLVLRSARIRIVALNNLGRVVGEIDRDIPAALGYFRQSLELATNVGLRTMVAMALRNVAEAHADLDELPLAIAFSKRAMQVARDLENEALFCVQALQSAIYRIRMSGYQSAGVELSVAFDALASDPYRTELPDQLDRIAELLLGEEQTARAVILLTASAAQRVSNGAGSKGAGLNRHERLMWRAPTQLDRKEYDAVRALAVGLSVETSFRAALLAPESPLVADPR